MKRCVYTEKWYDYKNESQAKQDIPKMKEQGWTVKDEYDVPESKVYCVHYYKDTLCK